MAPSSSQTLIMSSSCQSSRSEVHLLIGSQATKIDVEGENARQQISVPSSFTKESKSSQDEKCENVYCLKSGVLLK